MVRQTTQRCFSEPETIDVMLTSVVFNSYQRFCETFIKSELNSCSSCCIFTQVFCCLCFTNRWKKKLMWLASASNDASVFVLEDQRSLFAFYIIFSVVYVVGISFRWTFYFCGHFKWKFKVIFVFFVFLL